MALPAHFLDNAMRCDDKEEYTFAAQRLLRPKEVAKTCPTTTPRGKQT